MMVQPENSSHQLEVRGEWNGRKIFKDKYGIDPIDTHNEEISKEWKQSRCDAVSSLVKELKSIAKNKDKKISAAVFPYPEMSKEMVLQDWSSWELDIVCPMNYHHSVSYTHLTLPTKRIV